MKVFDDNVLQSVHPSKSEILNKEVSIQAHGLHHYSYEGVFIRIDQIESPTYAVGDFARDNEKSFSIPCAAVRRLQPRINGFFLFSWCPPSRSHDRPSDGCKRRWKRLEMQFQSSDFRRADLTWCVVWIYCIPTRARYERYKGFAKICINDSALLFAFEKMSTEGHTGKYLGISHFNSLALFVLEPANVERMVGSADYIKTSLRAYHSMLLPFSLPQNPALQRF